MPPNAGLENISPAQAIHGTLPSGLPQPPLTPESSSKLGAKLVSSFFFLFSDLIIFYFLYVGY